MSKKKSSNTTNNTKKKKSGESSSTKSTTRVSAAAKAEPTKNMAWIVLAVLVAIVGVVLSQDHHHQSEDNLSSSRPVVPQEQEEQPTKTTLVDDKKEEIIETEVKTNLNADASSIYNNGGKKKTTLSELFDLACTQTGLAKCNLDDIRLDDDRRTILATQDIPTGGIFLEISPQLHISALDAVRDPRIRAVLEASPVSGLTDLPPTGYAYLAFFLALEMKRLLHTQEGDLSGWSPRDQVLHAYFDYLPTLEDFQAYHPVAKDIFRARKEFFGESSDDEESRDDDDESDAVSSAFTPSLDQSIANNVDKIIYEYRAFSKVSETFEDLVSFEDYVWAQLVINTRVYGSSITLMDVDDDELEEYLPHLHFGDKDQLSQAIIPLADSFNDNRRLNARYHFNVDRASDPRAVAFFADRTIRAGEEIFVTYGEDSDFQRLAQYGFINTDGSELAMVSFAPYHRPGYAVPAEKVDEYEEIRKGKLATYLNFMDGYEECPEVDVEEGKVRRKAGREDKLFQYARYKALLDIFHSPKYWSVLVPDSGKIKLNEHVLTTCRILAMTHRDYGGMAMPLLGRFGLNEKYDALKGSGEEALEYRTYHVLERLATGVSAGIRDHLAPLAANDTTDGAVEARVKRRLDSGDLDPRSLEGLRAYVLLRELRNMRKVIDLARGKKDFYLVSKQKKVGRGEAVNEEDYVVRTEECPPPLVPFDWTPYVTATM